MTIPSLKSSETDSIIGALAALDALAFSGLLDDPQLDVVARPLRRTDPTPHDSAVEDSKAYVHRRLDELIIRCREVFESD